MTNTQLEKANITQNKINDLENQLKYITKEIKWMEFILIDNTRSFVCGEKDTIQKVKELLIKEHTEKLEILKKEFVDI